MMGLAVRFPSVACTHSSPTASISAILFERNSMI
jgi:hypothetical protein